MDDMLVVNFAAMRTAGDHIQAAIATLDDQLGQLERDAAPLVATWSGEARAAFDVRQRQWRSAATELSHLLVEIRRALEESAHDYRNTEHRNVRLFE